MGRGLYGPLIIEERKPIRVDRDITWVLGDFHKGLEYELINFVYSQTALREQAPDWPVALADNPLSEPDLADAQIHDVTFTGGMMGPMVMREMGRGDGMGSGTMGSMRSMMEMMHSGKMWFINGVAAEDHVLDFL